MSDIEKDLEKQIEDIQSAVEKGTISPEEGEAVLREIASALDALGLAKKEVLAQRLVTAITVAKSLV